MTRKLVAVGLIAAGSVGLAHALHDDPAESATGTLPTIGDSPVLTLRSAEWQAARARLAVAEWVAAHPPPPPAPPARRWSADWNSIAQCETGGNWQMSGPIYSGGLGFANTTWSGYGGSQYAANAGSASKYEQMLVAENVYAKHGLSGWGCRRYG